MRFISLLVGRRPPPLGASYLRRFFEPVLALRLVELDFDALDARALDLQHLEAAAVVCGLVARLRLASEQAEDEASDRVVILDREGTAELLVEVVDREGAVDAHP